MSATRSVAARRAPADGRPPTTRPAGRVEIRCEVRPPWPFRLPRRLGLDRLLRRRGEMLERVLHRGVERVVVRVAQPARERVLFGAWADSREVAEWGIERMRLAVGVDHDLRPFHERFRFDALIGAAVRADPGLRILGRPVPFEALTFAITEQLIEYERAAAIQRRLIWHLGRRCPTTGLRDAPSADALAAQAPALLTSLDLAPARALTLVRVAHEVAKGRIDLETAEPESGWRRLRAIPGIGSWTVQMLGLTGQGRLDQIPAGDLGYLKFVGRVRTGDPYARASEAEVMEFFAPYAPWSGLAGAYALRGGVGGASSRLAS